MKTRLEAYWREVIDRRAKDPGLSTSERYRQSIKRNRAVVMGLAAALAVLIALISVQFDKSWRDYNAAFGANSATQNWLGGKLNSYSQDAYDSARAARRRTAIQWPTDCWQHEAN